MADRPFAIAVDGPASSGKGTVARAVARTLGFAYVDTGAMYRSVALRGARAGIELSNGAALAALIGQLDFDFQWDGEQLAVLVDGEDLTQAIRSERVGQGASTVAALPPVRKALLDQQRQLAARRGVVMDGRDIGTVILPDAQLKVFLDASVQIRAQRRYQELKARGEAVQLRTVRQELEQRDANDVGRTIAPLRQADDAIYLDSSELSPAQATARVLDLARARGA